MPNSADDALSSAKEAMAHAEETEALGKTSPTPVPEGLKPETKTAVAAPKSDYSLARKLRSHKEDVEEALKSTQ